MWTHLIFSTKDRYPFLSDRDIREQLHAYLAALADHVHALFLLSRNHRKVTFQDEYREFLQRYKVELLSNPYRVRPDIIINSPG